MAIERLNPVTRVGSPGLSAEEEMTSPDYMDDSIVGAGMDMFGDEGMEVEIDFDFGDDFDLMQEEDAFDEPEPEPFDANLAEIIAEEDPSALSSWGLDLVIAVGEDKESRKEWEEVFVEGLKLMGIRGKDTSDESEREELFEGASQLYHPLITEAVIQFQAEALKSMIPPKGPVETQIMGVETPEKKDQSRRVRGFLNYLLMIEMPDYVEEHDKMLMYLGKSGSAFKKIWYNPVTSKIEIAYFPAEDIIVPYHATSLAKTPRIAHKETISQDELSHRVAAGLYRDTTLQPATITMDETQEALDKQSGESAPTLPEAEEYCIYELHVNTVVPYFENDRNGLSAPYIVHVEEETGTVLGVYRNWNEGDILFERKDFFTHYPMIQSEGFYGYGFIHLLGSLARGATAALRQILDAGTLSNLQGGFKKKGTRLANDGDGFTPGEYRDVDTITERIQDSIMPLQFNEPSTVLYQLLGFLVDAGRRMVSLTDINVGDGNQEAPVGTTVALLERGMNVMSAVHVRMCRAQHNEFTIVKRLCREHLAPTYPYDVPGEAREVFQTDFDASVDVVPVCDPRQFSQAQRIARAQNKLQLASQAPQIFNQREAYRDMLREIDDSDVDRLIPPEEDAVPQDPLTENTGVIEGKPLKAFIQQNHEAHIATHQAQLQNPDIADMVQAQKALQAHIQEHVAMRYQQQMMMSMGIENPQQMQQMQEEMGMEQFAAAIAQAAQKVTGQAQAMAEAARRAEEPTLEQKVLIKETENDRMEIARKAQEDQRKHDREILNTLQDQVEHRESVAQKDRASQMATTAQVFSTEADLQDKGLRNLIDIFKTISENNREMRQEQRQQAGPDYPEPQEGQDVELEPVDIPTGGEQ